MTKSGNSPDKILSRLMHRDNPEDYFQFIPEYEIGLWKPKMMKHISKCRHPNCLYYKSNQEMFGID